MKLPTDPLLPLLPADASEFDRQMYFRMTLLLREFAQQVNMLSEGAVQAATNAATSAPTTGNWQIGDVVRNSAPSETGSAGSKYVVGGWICVAAGTPGTWKETRWLTGN